MEDDSEVVTPPANETQQAVSSEEQLHSVAEESRAVAQQPAAGAQQSTKATLTERLVLAAITLGVFLVYVFSNPEPRNFYDYSFRIAEAILHGRLGLTENPGSWLNEMIHFGDRYYSAFPLGSVLSMMPFAILKLARVINGMPGGLIAALLAGASSYFFFLLSAKYSDSLGRRALLALFPLLATWTWANLAFGAAWQLALGFAVLGQVGALYFILIKPRPVIAGLFFAMAFGNRTEVLLVAPLFVYFLLRHERRQLDLFPPTLSARVRTFFASTRERRREIADFLFVPVLLGILTLAYNYARFRSPFDFGYTRIPSIQHEAWFKHGLFSIHAIPDNAKAMLSGGWRILDHKPYLVPAGFGGSIFLSSPILFLLFRRKLRDRATVTVCWIAIAALTLALWLHSNPGGWQFSYRYAMILLPWMFLVLLDNGRAKTSWAELALFVLSVTINAYATYEFLWTSNVQP
jgi:hypothetical protein